jgi:hypothetical protein
VAAWHTTLSAPVMLFAPVRSSAEAAQNGRTWKR